jgi:hypothetical protein
VFISTLLFAQDQNNIGVYSGNKINPEKGMKISELEEYLVLTGLSISEKSSVVDVFLRRGDEAVTITECKPQNGVLTIKVEDILKNEATFKPGDQIVIKLAANKIYSIPIK